MTGDLRAGLMLGYWAAQPLDGLPLVQRAEELGFASVWTAEAYGSDAVSPLAWWGAHTSRIELGTGLMQLSARTPASTAMTAVTMDHLSGGRFVLGLGVSGPQVVEGWYGQPFPKPLARTREYIGVLRDVWAREAPVVSDGPHYPLPYPGGAQLGKPLRITTHPRRRDIPIMLGAEGPRNVALAAEIADGWLPIFYSPERSTPMYAESLAAAPEGFRIACPVTIVVDDDVDQARSVVKWSLAFYIGGMGAKDENFHLNVIARMGFEEEAKVVQKRFLDGDREGAMQAVPDALADEISLVGPPGRIRERVQRWVDSPVTDVLLGTRDPRALEVVAEVLC
ncbi:LLM class F420-dependent oxidoreductase [Nitriliruptor alkaliphilus]|uniref:LLM class F420-dependent oxidoreductase n=1 Tax=Nitriliruptor alkaliphilus TaxID=427918 RepID=UPI000696AA90|nr:LLM class F420-dependent oxidoreductase [Nitriliruptor alkaliphilus]